MNHVRQAHMVHSTGLLFLSWPQPPDTHGHTHILPQTWSSQGQQRILGSWLGLLLPH